MSLVLRATKGSRLSTAEMDANLSGLADLSLTTFAQSGSGALSGTVQGELRSLPINAVTQFGLSTSGTGSANCTALANAIAAAGSTKAVYIPGGTYSVDPSGGTLTAGCKIYGDGRNVTILQISGNGDFMSRTSYSTLMDMTIDMQGATYAGHACKFPASSAYQVDRSVIIKNLQSGKYALNFAADGGSQFNSYGCNYHTLATAGTDAAVKVTGTDTAASPRSFHGTNGDGCTVWDIGGAADFFIFGGFTNNLLFSSTAPVNVCISGLRIGTTSGTVTIKGTQHQIMGCMFADPVVLHSSTTSVRLDSVVTANNVTDNGTGNQVYYGATAYTPTWTGASANPVYGNATLVAFYSRAGAIVTVCIDLTMGGTTTFGTGQWFFSLPETDNSNIVQLGSSFEAIDSSASAVLIGDVRVEPGSQKLSMRYSNAGIIAAVGSATFAWASTDTVRLTMSYFRP